MVNGVSFNGGYGNVVHNSYDMENVVKYALGTTIVNPEPSPFDGMGLMLGITGAMEAFKLGKWALGANKEGKLKEAWTDVKTAYGEDLATRKALLGNGGWKNIETYKQVWNDYSTKLVLDGIPKGEAFTKLSTETQNAYNAVKAEFVKTLPPKEILANANKAMAEANHLAYLEKAGAEAKGFGKVTQTLSKFTGLSKLTGFVSEVSTKSPVVANLLKFGKGNGAFIAITGAVELFTQVIPAFGLGADKGIKQLGKSAVKTAASVGGWAAGAAVGAAIGSIIPGAGTVIGGAIGALIGVIGGCIGSWAATKVADAVVGKSELEIAQEEQAKNAVAEANKNPEVARQLLMTAQAKLQQEGAESEDAKVALASLQRIAGNGQPQPQTQSYPAVQGQYSPSMAGSGNPFSSPDFMTKDFMSMGMGLA